MLQKYLYICIKSHFQNIYLFIQQTLVEPVFRACPALNTGEMTCLCSRGSQSCGKSQIANINQKSNRYKCYAENQTQYQWGALELFFSHSTRGDTAQGFSLPWLSMLVPLCRGSLWWGRASGGVSNKNSSAECDYILESKAIFSVPRLAPSVTCGFFLSLLKCINFYSGKTHIA